MSTAAGRRSGRKTKMLYIRARKTVGSRLSANTRDTRTLLSHCVAGLVVRILKYQRCCWIALVWKNPAQGKLETLNFIELAPLAIGENVTWDRAS